MVSRACAFPPFRCLVATRPDVFSPSPQTIPRFNQARKAVLQRAFGIVFSGVAFICDKVRVGKRGGSRTIQLTLTLRRPPATQVGEILTSGRKPQAPVERAGTKAPEVRMMASFL